MKVSPLDIRKQTFKKVLRGVDPEEVRMFLELIASEYEKVVQDNAMMAEKLSYQEERLEEYRELEKSLRNSLVTAERIAAESREASSREAERVIQDAHTRAERILEDSRERLQRLVQDIESLRNKKEIYVRRFRTMLEGQLGVLADHEQHFDQIDSIQEGAHQILARSETEPFEEPRYEDREAGGYESAEAVPEYRDSARESNSQPQERIEEARTIAATAAASAAAARAAEPISESRLGDETTHGYADPNYAGSGYSTPSASVSQEPRVAEERRDYRVAAAGDPDANGADQARLPLGEQAYSQEQEESDKFFRIRERKEGFFEFDAGDSGDSDIRGAQSAN